MQRTDEIWKQEGLANVFLEGVRRAIPLGAEQIDVLLRIVRARLPRLGRFLDLGCGDGILGRALLARFPGSEAVFLDFSEPMLARARQAVDSAGTGARARFVTQDFGAKGWEKSLPTGAPFDLVVSGFAIHHQPDARKREIYTEIFGVLRPGGLFLNLEHVSSRSDWGAGVFDDLFIDSLHAFHRQANPGKTREEVATEFYNRPDKAANILAPLELQCAWLREIGFADVDCFLKILELALFGGLRPA